MLWSLGCVSLCFVRHVTGLVQTINALAQDFHEDIPIFLAHSTVNKWVMLDVSQGSLCKLRHPTARNCVQINLHSAQHEISIVCH